MIEQIVCYNRAIRCVNVGNLALRVQEPAAIDALHLVQEYRELMQLPSNEMEAAFRRKVVVACWVNNESEPVLDEDVEDAVLDNMPWSVFNALYTVAFSMILDSQATVEPIEHKQEEVE